eukprot:TRINITY_DN11607_c0_g1_i3.p1 TRINITY_DN11607_c0_g1~~TRINITY_DN11607_c0_g1_i3.p1  ORF type:complete len:218 (-),score=38.65 TRINITY_DN11607_c0_g1_i3:6-599(-)
MCIRDSAHAIGNVPINITEIGAEFYLANFHKWFSGAKTSSFLYASKSVQENLYPTIIGKHNNDGFIRRFFLGSKKIYGAILAINEAFEFRQKFGEEEIMRYNRDLAWKAANRMSEIWGTELLVRNSTLQAALVNIRMPTDDPKVAAWISEQLLLRFNTYLPPITFNGKVYTRISANIFNELADFEYGAYSVLNLLNL